MNIRPSAAKRSIAGVLRRDFVLKHLGSPYHQEDDYVGFWGLFRFGRRDSGQEHGKQAKGKKDSHFHRWSFILAPGVSYCSLPDLLVASTRLRAVS